jgi:hypothetical protein
MAYVDLEQGAVYTISGVAMDLIGFATAGVGAAPQVYLLRCC